MKFSILADAFEKLEATTKRLEMTSILAELFKKAKVEEIDKIIYLCQENLLPPYKGLEIGMAEKMVEKAIAKVSQKNLKSIEQEYKKSGDLGIVAFNLIPKKKATLIQKKELEINEVYEKLFQIAKLSGAGSVDYKINTLSGLLSSLSNKEAKYVVRFVLGRLRLGIGDPTIMDSLSEAKRGDKSLRPEIERAYNLCCDLGLVAKVLWKKGEKGLKEFEVVVGIPIRMALAERLPSAEEIIKKIGKCAVETKYDGFRLQCHAKQGKVEIFSRRLERMTHMFPELVGALKKIKAKEFIIEGEAVAFNEVTHEFLPFQVTIQRKRKYGIEEMAKEFPLVLFTFDILYLNGKDLTKKPYKERRRILEQLIKKQKLENIRIAEMMITDKAEKLSEFFEKNVEAGTEGIIAKRLDSEYQAGARNFNWIKLKRSYKGELQDTIDVVIVGYFKGKGLRVRLGIGALLACVYDEKEDKFKTIAKIGSGLSEEKWKELVKLLDKIKLKHKHARVDSLIEADVWTEPKYVFTVMADEITKSPVHTAGRKKEKKKGKEIEEGFALRFPRIQGWIRDKRPEDATSVKEIEEMFKMQKRVKL